eukprot:CAMPEP_0198204344 /NCGR_PEP_ID=MMETSP1445-20131203/7748_1 /TAXON_ID=36898 /ORGANISM="Pyramimonas sp., Strain CCMP2087" /LENGTH=251 /DNA_ID=CAMNT_0043876183 /DNA_START=113 /DNA_END=870 /DNA_ORIENTATION=+
MFPECSLIGPGAGDSSRDRDHPRVGHGGDLFQQQIPTDSEELASREHRGAVVHHVPPGHGEQRQLPGVDPDQELRMEQTAAGAAVGGGHRWVHPYGRDHSPAVCVLPEAEAEDIDDGRPDNYRSLADDASYDSRRDNRRYQSLDGRPDKYRLRADKSNGSHDSFVSLADNGSHDNYRSVADNNYDGRSDNYRSLANNGRTGRHDNYRSLADNTSNGRRDNYRSLSDEDEEEEYQMVAPEIGQRQSRHYNDS